VAHVENFCELREHLDIFVRWKASHQAKLYLKLGDLDGCFIPTDEFSLLCYARTDAVERPTITLWYGGQALELCTTEDTDMSIAQKIWGM